MSQSIFDPGGNQTEHSGSTFMGPEGQDRSRMPPDLVDGEVSDEEADELDRMAQCSECPGLPGLIATPFDTINETENNEQPGML